MPKPKPDFSIESQSPISRVNLSEYVIMLSGPSFLQLESQSPIGRVNLSEDQGGQRALELDQRVAIPHWSGQPFGAVGLDAEGNPVETSQSPISRVNLSELPAEIPVLQPHV